MGRVGRAPPDAGLTTKGDGGPEHPKHDGYDASLGPDGRDKAVFKKALQVVTAFGLLLAGYAGYVQLFALVVAHVAPPRVALALEGPRSESDTRRRAIDLAAGSFGPGHWSAADDLQIRYYSAEKGYWMYAKEYERLDDGKRVLLKPFAIIWGGRDGKGLKTATSDEAVIDLDKAIGVVSGPGDSAMHVVHAQISGNVRIRDNKGTPDVLEDDLLIGPMPYVEYDEPSLQIRSDSDVVIQDRDMRVTGFGLRIILRPKGEGGPSGFNGAKTAILEKDIHIVIQDVGQSGVMPGKAMAPPGQMGRTQLDLRCQGPMQIDLPEPTAPLRVGPPAPPAPTYASFTRAVRVLRGNVGLPPDQLDSDYLRLTLLPAEKSAAPAAKDGTIAAEPVGVGGPMTELTLREARASGHAVWLQSESQGIKARCNELIHKKLPTGKLNETYLRGDATTKLYVEKLEHVTEGPKKGQIASVTTIRSIDATLFDNGQDGGPSTIVSRGPGLLETRPARDKPVERTAYWEDMLETVDEVGPDKLVQKRVTLTGHPKFVDTAQATSLVGQKTSSKIIVWLKPRPKPEASISDRPTADATVVRTPDGGKAAPSSGSSRIDRLLALVDVQLTAPGQNIIAHDQLATEFVYPPPVIGPPPARTAPAPTVPPSGAAPDANAGPKPAGAKSDPQALAKAKPDEPDVVVKAHRVWAKILMRPRDAPGAAGEGKAGGAIGGGKSEIQEVRLRGAVDFHQDAAPGKLRGTDVTGEAVDLINQGEGKSKFKVFSADPFGAKPRRGDPGHFAIPFARVETDEFTIEGPVIGLDQKADQSWVDGQGTLTQMAERGLLTDKGLTPDTKAAEKGKAKGEAGGAEAKKVPMKITWKKDMKFFGQATDLKGKPAARAHFSGGVRAEHGSDGLLVCEDMTTYMDRTVSLARPRRDPKAAADDPLANVPEPKPQIAVIDCVGKVIAISRKVDKTGKLLEQQRIEGDHITYDKLSGEFEVFGEGQTFLYALEDQEKGALAPGNASAPRTITPVADPGRGDAGGGRTTPVIGRNTARGPAGSSKPAAKDQAKAKAMAKAPALVLTQIRFRNGMRGRFGSGKDADRTETRRADFFKDVEAMHAKVADQNKKLDPDALPADAFFLTADILRVVSEPPPGGGDGPSRNFLKAWEDVNAIADDKTIQADVLTYDSFNELFYAYGEEGREVTIAQQSGPGQPALVIPGRAVRYNRKTGESQLIEPRSVRWLDAKTGTRPTLVGPPGPAPKPGKRPRTPYRAPARKDQERRGFNGR